MSVEVPSNLDEKDPEPEETAPAEGPSEAEAAESGNPAEGDNPEAGGESAEPPQRRRELREFEISGSVTVKEQAFPLKNWSSSGFAVSECAEVFEENERVDIDFAITLESGPLSFSCKAIIVRADPESGDMAGAFVEMRREDRVAVANYFEIMESEVAPEA